MMEFYIKINLDYVYNVQFVTKVRDIAYIFLFNC